MRGTARVLSSARWCALAGLACAALGIVAAGATARGGRPGVPRRPGQPPLHKGFIPNGVYGAAVTYSLGTVRETFTLRHHDVVEIDTSGAANGAGCFQNDPSTGNNTPIGALKSFKVRVDPPFPTRLGVAIGRVGHPYLFSTLPVPLSDVIEATPPGGTSLPLTSAAMAWGLSYSPGNFLFPLFHNRTIRGPRVVGTVVVSLEWGDYTNGGILCNGGDPHMLLRKPPVSYSGVVR